MRYTVVFGSFKERVQPYTAFSSAVGWVELPKPFLIWASLLNSTENKFHTDNGSPPVAMIGCMLPTLCCPLDPLVWQKWTINLRFPKCGWPDRHTEWKTEGTPAMTVAWCTAKQLESKHSNIQYWQHSADEKSTVNQPLCCIGAAERLVSTVGD